ncbi:MAG: hypothetical protein ACLQBB_00515 [Solirubrobacteraceae bacterium]
MSAYSSLSTGAGMSFLEGVVPDGAGRAELVPPAGPPTELVLADGAYRADAPDHSVVWFERGGRRYAVPVPQAPAPLPRDSG